MSSWFDTQVQHLKNKIPSVSPSLTSFMRGMLWNEHHDENRTNEVVLTLRSRSSVATREWWELTWVDEDGTRKQVESQKLDLLMWRAIQVHINVLSQNEGVLARVGIEHGCRQCALDGKKMIARYSDDGDYMWHCCEDHHPDFALQK